MHEVTVSDYELPAIEEWFAGDDRRLTFTVTDASATGIDISSATVSWALYRRKYQDDPADAILDDGESGVEVVTDARVDTTVGEFEIRVDGAATADLWGQYFHRPVVEQADGSVASWRGEVTIEA